MRPERIYFQESLGLFKIFHRLELRYSSICNVQFIKRGIFGVRSLSMTQLFHHPQNGDGRERGTAGNQNGQPFHRRKTAAMNLSIAAARRNAKANGNVSAIIWTAQDCAIVVVTASNVIVCLFTLKLQS